MDKHRFLRGEYERILGSGDYVWSGWRDSFDRFRADLWDMTPAWISGRYLAARDKELGFSPDNVEWHFRKSRALEKPAKSARPLRAGGKGAPKQPRKATQKPLTAAERKRLGEIAREERRQRLAEEFRRWEAVRRQGSGPRGRS